MTFRDIIDQVFLAQAGKVELDLAAILNAISRLDLDSSVDRFLFWPGFGHMLGIPSRPGTSSAATTGVPTNSIAGFTPGAIFINYKGTAGSVLYTNIGSVTSTTWLNIA